MKGELGWLTHPYGKGVSKPAGRREAGEEGCAFQEGGSQDQTLQVNQASNCLLHGTELVTKARADWSWAEGKDHL